MSEELLHCPYCGSIQKLAFSFHTASDKKHRYGCYDGAIYCRNCYSYGPRIKSEDLGIPSSDFRNTTPTAKMKDVMLRVATEAWNRRVNDDAEAYLQLRP